MLNARLLSVTTLGVSLLAAVALPFGAAQADARRAAFDTPGASAPGGQRDLDSLREPVAEGPLVATGELDPTAWDIPGEIIVDARDDLDAEAIRSLARDFGL